MFDDRVPDPDPRTLIERHHEDAWRWALSCARGDREAAMETLQDAYTLLLDGRARFEGRSSFKTFLFGVVRRRAQAARRKSMWRDWVFAPIERAHHIPDDHDAEAGADAARVRRAMAALSERQRQTAELVLIHGFTVADAAEALGISRGSASRHYAAAKDRLRASLGRSGASVPNHREEGAS